MTEALKWIMLAESVVVVNRDPRDYLRTTYLLNETGPTKSRTTYSK